MYIILTRLLSRDFSGGRRNQPTLPSLEPHHYHRLTFQVLWVCLTINSHHCIASTNIIKSKSTQSNFRTWYHHKLSIRAYSNEKTSKGKYNKRLNSPPAFLRSLIIQPTWWYHLRPLHLSVTNNHTVPTYCLASQCNDPITYSHLWLASISN